VTYLERGSWHCVLVVGVVATLLMFHLWGYPYDKEKVKSTAPAIWLFTHRALGWVFVGL